MLTFSVAKKEQWHYQPMSHFWAFIILLSINITLDTKRKQDSYFLNEKIKLTQRHTK